MARRKKTAKKRSLKNNGAKKSARAKRPRWRKEHLKLLRENAGEQSVAWFKKQTGRTEAGIRTKASEIGVSLRMK